MGWGCGTRGFPTWGSSTDELKSTKDPFGGTSLAGAMSLQVGAGERGAPGLGVTKEMEEGEPQPPAQIPAWPDPGSLSLGLPGTGFP